VAVYFTRRDRMLELDPVYVAVMVRRWQECTGKEATLEGDGRSFRELCAERIPSLSEPGASVGTGGNGSDLAAEGGGER
jgi:hypothetical protein